MVQPAASYCGTSWISFVWVHSSLSVHRSGTCALDGVAAVKQRCVSRVGVEVPAFIFSFFSFYFFESWLHVPTTPLLLLLPAALTLVPGELERAQRPYSRCEYFFFLFFFLFTPPNVLVSPLRAAWPDTCQRGVGATPHRSAFSPQWKKKTERENEWRFAHVSVTRRHMRWWRSLVLSSHVCDSQLVCVQTMQQKEEH